MDLKYIYPPITGQHDIDLKCILQLQAEEEEEEEDVVAVVKARGDGDDDAGGIVAATTVHVDRSVAWMDGWIGWIGWMDGWMDGQIGSYWKPNYVNAKVYGTDSSAYRISLEPRVTTH